MAVRVRLLSGEVVWEGERPATLAALRAAVARAWGAPPAELEFFPVQAPGGRLDEAAWDEAAPGELMAVRDAAMGLLPAFLSFLRDSWEPPLPEELKPVVSHRHCMLAAVQQQGEALGHASAELRADREFVLAAVQQHGEALEHASAELRADRAVVLAAVGQHGWALQFASAESLTPEQQAVRTCGVAVEAATPQPVLAGPPQTEYLPAAPSCLDGQPADLYVLSCEQGLRPGRTSLATKDARLLSHRRAYGQGAFFLLYAPNYGHVETALHRYLRPLSIEPA